MFQKIAQDLQDEMQAAIAEAEKLGELSKADVEAAADALMEKTDVIRRCENLARDMAEDFFSKNSAAMKAQFREEMLASAAHKLRNAGKSAEEIVAVLGVDTAFVKKHVGTDLLP
jgi:hypothetical protein